MENDKRYQSIVEVLQMRAITSPQRIAYTFLGDGEKEESSITYDELNRAAQNLAGHLRQHYSPGERAILLFPSGLDFIVAFMGCLYAGIVAVPTHPPHLRRSLQTLKSIVSDARATLALTTEKYHKEFKSHLHKLLDVEEFNWVVTTGHLEGEGQNVEAVDPQSLAFLQYTSGSTSDPKGVQVTHQNLLINQQMICDSFEHDQNSTFVGWLPFYHDMGLIGNILQPLYIGAKCILMPPAAFIENPFRWLMAISRYRAHTSGGPNSAFNLCVEKAKGSQIPQDLDLSSWKLAFNGSEPIHNETLERFTQAFQPFGFKKETFYPCYGLAEATLFVSGSRKNENRLTISVAKQALSERRVHVLTDASEQSQECVGSGYVNSEQCVCVVDPESGLECKEDEIGEIWISGKNISKGYWEKDVANQQIFHASLKEKGKFFRTGDLGFFHQQQLFLSGRLKDVIIIRGRNYYPQDLELAAVRSHSSLRPTAAAFSRYDQTSGEQLVIAVELKREARKADPVEIACAVRKFIMEEYGVFASTIVLVKNHGLPVTSSGKIRRQLCKKLFMEKKLLEIARVESNDSNSSQPAARNEETPKSIKTFLFTMICQSLSIPSEQLDEQKTLPSLGIDSFNALKFKHQIDERYHTNIPLSFLLGNHSIADLIEYVEHFERKAVDVVPTLQLEGLYDLSVGQKSLLFLDQLSDADFMYHLTKCIKIEGEIDIKAFKEALEYMVTRHPMLNMRIQNADNEPKQSFDDHELDFEFCEVNDEKEWHQYLESKRSAKHFKTKLLSLGKNEWVLVFGVHHMQIDLWSAAVFLQEFFQVYRDFLHHRKPALTPTTARYVDFITWQKKWVESAEGKKAADYWTKMLSQPLPVLQMPLDFKRPAFPSYQAGVVYFNIDQDTVARLDKLAKQNETTRFVTLLTAFFVLLNRYSGQEDIIVGSPLSGRPTSEFREVLGYFVNTIALRTHISSDQTFGDLLRHMRNRVLDAYEHQHYPLAKILEKLQLSRETSHAPLFQALFTWQKIPVLEKENLPALFIEEKEACVDLDGLLLKPMTLPKMKGIEVDLDMALIDNDKMISGYLSFNLDIFQAETIQTMVNHFIAIVHEISIDAEQALSEIKMLSQEERQKLIELGQPETDNDQDVPKPLHFLFTETAAKFPNHPVVVDQGTSTTYGELDQESQNLANLITSLGE